MITDHTVKIHGILYRAGEELPALNNTVKPETKVVEQAKEPEIAKDNVETEKSYTRTDIMRLTSAQLRDLATENGIENADEYTGSELKKMLIEKFEL